MKIKSLLLGSAAAMVAVSGAQAADVVIVEPEPVEYVRVCDMYGAGFFYIPGTETCLRIGGHVRIDYRADMSHNDEDISNHDARVRGRLSVHARNETEMGTLGSTVAYGIGYTNDSNVPHDAFSAAEFHSATTIGMAKATINLAGFRAGYDAVSAGAWNRYGGYGYYNARFDGFYLFNTALFFEYGGQAGDIGYVVGIQDSNVSGAAGQPDLYAGLTYSTGALALGAVVMWDSNGGANNVGGVPVWTNGGALAYRIRADYDLSSFMPGASIGAWWDADDGETDYVKGHRWGVTMRAAMGDKFTVFAGYSAYDYAYADLAGVGWDAQDWTVGVRWNLVPGLYVQAEWNKQFADGNYYFGNTESSVDRFNLRMHRSF